MQTLQTILLIIVKILTFALAVALGILTVMSITAGLPPAAPIAFGLLTLVAAYMSYRDVKSFLDKYNQ
jgi:hypothetical protein